MIDNGVRLLLLSPMLIMHFIRWTVAKHLLTWLSCELIMVLEGFRMVLGYNVV